jgi:tetratricopeptide (TPR) repeat protein
LTSISAVDRIRFSHALVRETLYEALGPTGRRQAHLRAGEALESLYASNPEPHLAELAHHFFEALPAAEPARAIDYGRRAGDRARQLLAYEEAVRLYELALGALDLEGNGADDRRCALLVALGDAQARAGDESAARATFLHAAELATRAGLPYELATAALGYGGRFVWARAYGDVRLIPLLEHALSLLPADASVLRVKLMARLAGALRDSPTRERRASLSAQAVEIARRLGDPATLAYALAGRYGALMWPENPEERLAVADEIVALAEQAADREREIEARNYGVIAQMELGRMTEVEAELEIAAQRAEALRQPAQMWMTAAIHAVVALFTGRFDEAEALIGAALRLGERAQRRDAVVSHRLQLFMLWRETKRVAEIDELMGRAVAEFPTRPIFRCALASVRAELGDGGQAQCLLADLAANDFGVINRDNEYLLSLGFLADTARDLGDARAAAVLYDLLVPYAHLNASNADELAAGSVSRPLGVLAATMTRWEDAGRHFDVALTQNTAMGARPWVAHSRHDYAQMLLQRDNAGDRERGRDLLSAARTDYEAMAMTAWAQRAQEVLAGI